MYRAVGLIEISSIAKGIEVADAMLKSAEVELLISKTICPGKYIIMIGGDVSAVTQAVDVGESLADYLLVDKFILNNLHPTILPAISGVTPVDEIKSIGVVETFSVAACINAADFSVKVANVSLIRIHMAYGIGGKCYFVLNGDVSSVEASVAKASEVAGEAGLLVYSTVIPGPSLQLAEQLL